MLMREERGGLVFEAIVRMLEEGQLMRGYS